MKINNVETTLPRFLKNISLVEFIPKEATEDMWEAYFTLNETIFSTIGKGGRLPDRGRVRRFFSTSNPLYSVKRWLVLDKEGKAIASAWMSYDTESSPDYESNKHICQVNITVVPSYRRKKLRTFLMKNIIQTARLLKRDTIIAEADTLGRLEFFKHLRGEPVHEEVRYRLDMEDVDWQLVEQWLKKGRTKSLDIKVEFFQDCPEKDIEEFCRTYTEIINQRPTGDMEGQLITTPESRRIEERNMKKRGTDWYTMISREPDGRISGLTDIMYNREEPYKINQYFTGVLTRYRNRGLAKRLKAEMLVVIKNRFPDVEYITTTTARSNRPMRSINKQLGFQSTKTVFMFRWSLPDLEKQVDRNLQGLH